MSVVRKNKKGFTLVELAIVLVVIGILLGLGVALLGPLTKQAIFKRSRERVKACKEAIIGFVVTSRRLPTQQEFQSICNQKDAWGRSLIYIPDDSTVNYDGNNDRADLTTQNTCCSSLPSDMAVNDRAFTGGANNYKEDVAFIVLSEGENRSQDGSLVTGQDVDGVIYALYTIEEYTDTYDDIIEYVTVYELRDAINCEPLQIVTTSLPDGTEDSSYNAKILATGGCPSYNFTLSGGTLPAGLGLSTDGTVSGTVNVCSVCPSGTLEACTEQSNFTVQVTDAIGTSLTQAYTININPQLLKILTSTLADATINIPYATNVIGAGGNISSYSFTISGLPAGLTFTASSDCNTDGYNECSQITGTPSGTCGDYSVSVQLNDGCTSSSKSLTLHLYNPLSCSLTGTGTDNGDGTWTYTLNWTVTGEDVLGQINGLFSPQSGTCTTINTSSTTNTTSGSCTTDPLSNDTTFVLRVNDTCGDSAKCEYTAMVSTSGGTACSTPLSLSPPDGTVFNATVGSAFSQTITVSGGLSPYTNTDCTNNCGAYGLALNCTSTDATISGTPTTSGTCTFTVGWQDSCSPPNTVTGTYTVNIAPACTPFTGWSSNLPDANNCEAYSGSITVIGGVSPYSWSLISGSLPNGINFCTGNTSATCDLTGTQVLDAPGTYSFTVEVQDSCTTPGPQSTSQSFSINVVDACYTSGISVRNETGDDRCYWREGDTLASIWRRNRTITISPTITTYYIGNIVGFNCIQQCTTNYCAQKGYDTDGDCQTRMRPDVCQFQDR